MHNLTKIRLFRILLWIIYPLAWIFIMPLSYLKKKSKGKLFFFFDRYCIGGAQRVHIDILQAVGDHPKKVYFTRYSPNDKMKKEFWGIPESDNKDIHFWCDNLLLRLFTVHFYAFYLNRHPGAVVLSSNSTFFYDMLPFISKRLKRIELLHNFSYGKKGMEFFGLANYRYLDYRMVIDTKTASQIYAQYREYSIPEVYHGRVLLVEAGTDIPQHYTPKDDAVINVLYAGRGGAQKRVWLLNRIVEAVLKQTSSVKFHFAGPIEEELSEKVKSVSVVYGEVGDKEKMQKIYSRAHIVLLVSAFEGFPMVIKEGMAWSAVPVVTALEGNKTHLKHMQNAMLIESVTDEAKCVEEATAYLLLLDADRALLHKLSKNAYDYACTHFSRKHFVESYRKLLLGS